MIQTHSTHSEILHKEEIEDEVDNQAAKMAWEYCNKIRRGEKVSRASYYKRLHSAEKDEFDFLVGMNEFVEQTADQAANNS